MVEGVYTGWLDLGSVDSMNQLQLVDLKSADHKHSGEADNTKWFIRRLFPHDRSADAQDTSFRAQC